ncbi:tRNA lysidine(34) synthetase TilS [Gymnodinialimonas ceratoperidinii]|nr:tRNA lysidine(34) synthetase TilS [Gymnodinialimonas ceratoperidinii]
MGRLLGPDFPSKIALAVSGGGDSMTMLALAHEWSRSFGVALHVVTVDHGLRPESRAEAALVAEECATLGHPHSVLNWQWDGQGNLQDAARRARLRLIGDWRGKIAHVLLAHTQDDQAETLLMRLARGSGVEGLSAMAPTRDMGGWQIVRPLLSERRATLRHHIDVLKVPYVDDPTNEDDSYERVRMRKAISALDLDVTVLSDTADRMARAREALAARAADVARTCVTETEFGELLIDRDRFATVERDTQLRLLAAAVQWITGASYRPRAKALDLLLDRALGGAGGTLQGAELRVTKMCLQILREFSPLQHVLQAAPEARLWDGRWRIIGTGLDGANVRALGPEGWAQMPKETVSKGLSHSVAVTLPALFKDGELVGFAPASYGLPHRIELCPHGGSFVASLLSR